MLRQNIVPNRGSLGLLFNRLLATTMVLAASACAAPAEHSQQMIIKLAKPSLDGGEIARMASQATGLPVTYVSASSHLLHAVSVACPNAAQCEDALHKLRQDAAFADAEWDRRMRPMQRKPPPAP